MKSRWVGTLVLLGDLIAGQAAWAQADAPARILILDPESRYFEAGRLAGLGKHLRSLARRYSSIEVVEPPALGIPELRLRARCVGSATGCLVKIGKAARVERVAHTEIQKLPGRYLVIMTLVDAEQGGLVEQARKRARRGRESLQGAMLQGWVDLVGPLYRTQVKVSANVRGAEVFLDGRRIGATPLVLTKELGRGTHVVELSHEGYDSVRHELEVGEGRDYVIEAELHREQAPAPLVGAKLGGGKQEATPPLEEPPLAKGDVARRPGLVPEPAAVGPEGKPDFMPDAPGASPPPVPGVEADREDRPFYTRWWFWTAVGAVVAGGVTAGLVLGLQDDGGIPAGKGRVVIDF